MKKERTYKKVSKEEFDNFVKNYPNSKKLNWDVFRACEPPMGSFNDFSDGKVWPESMVAKVFMDWMGPDGEIDESGSRKFWTYWILEDGESI